MITAIARGDVANYVEAVFLVYFVMILLRILLSWLQQARPLPYRTWLRVAVRFIEESTDPYLNLFRRLLPPLGPFDLSPILAILVLLLVEGLIVGAIRG
jgi:YggT family protein